MRNVVFAVTAVLATFSLLATANGAMRFNCGSGPGGICSCTGADDCVDMRHSGMCGSAGMHCDVDASGQTVCWCAAARQATQQPPAKSGTKLPPSPPSGHKTIGIKPPPVTGSQPGQ
jgi:hypothetical protein